jgi:hypothetical protein
MDRIEERYRGGSQLSTLEFVRCNAHQHGVSGQVIYVASVDGLDRSTVREDAMQDFTSRAVE